MTEYGREQRKQESRAIANSELRSRQLKKLLDNRCFFVSQKKSAQLMIDSVTQFDDPETVEGEEIQIFSIPTNWGNLYLLNGNEKYGLTHLRKHCKELSTVCEKLGWTGDHQTLLQKAIEKCSKFLYEGTDSKAIGNTHVLRLPLTARNVVLIPVADDGKIITAYIENSNSKDIRTFWGWASLDITSIGWNIVNSKDEEKRHLEDAPWGLDL